ncbi:hypothetical protein K458DRAFT_393881 [Lentithecium fluviatile CBS 122367]|uniref:Uncharacterized protein n=1 Tax=Lentithecium fluviatile CBS 122367 TaxID=1168545 RepID=A0A6G1INE5_9PLEO|nr:hypothetical protein K458DRAFT_393881 [Lentithecium fluviatile CBS 122367]
MPPSDLFLSHLRLAAARPESCRYDILRCLTCLMRVGGEAPLTWFVRPIRVQAFADGVANLLHRTAINLEHMKWVRVLLLLTSQLDGWISIVRVQGAQFEIPYRNSRRSSHQTDGMSEETYLRPPPDSNRRGTLSLWRRSKLERCGCDDVRAKQARHRFTQSRTFPRTSGRAAISDVDGWLKLATAEALLQTLSLLYSRYRPHDQFG